MSLGMGVMLKSLFGPRDVTDLTQVIGREILKIELQDKVLQIYVEGGKRLDLQDGGQSCCEHRYMTTDDDLPYFVGSQLVDIELADAPSQEDEYGAHEVQFLNVKTSKGVITLENHNEHNGYYGGFYIEAGITDV